jgi:hypothetical protein
MATDRQVDRAAAPPAKALSGGDIAATVLTVRRPETEREKAEERALVRAAVKWAAGVAIELHGDPGAGAQARAAVIREAAEIHHMLIDAPQTRIKPERLRAPCTGEGLQPVPGTAERKESGRNQRSGTCPVCHNRHDLRKDAGTMRAHKIRTLARDAAPEVAAP